MPGDERRRWSHPFQWLFHVCLLLLGSAIALNLAVGYIRAVLPWLVGGFLLAAMTWIGFTFIRWRQSRF